MTYDTWKTTEPTDAELVDAAAAREERLQADYEEWLATLEARTEADLEAMAASDAYFFDRKLQEAA